MSNPFSSHEFFSQTHSIGSLPRRRFLKTAAALAAASTLPDWFLKENEARAAEPAPGGDPLNIALVGCGGMGRGDAGNAKRLGKVTVLCDVDDSNLAEAKKAFPEARTYKDFRKVMEQKDIQVVICGTVDHWHTLVSLAALRAGKDVYCEKPLTLTIEEGQHLVKAVKSTGRILQTGSQQRSDKNFRLACELVRNGRLGKLKHISVFLPAGRREGPFLGMPVPLGFDWEFWLGPTPQVPYIRERGHVTFRYWWDYAGGTITDWGAHHNDIALWALGEERGGPVSVEGKPLVNMIPNGFSAVSEYDILYTYANGVTHSCQSITNDTWYGAPVEKEGQHHGVKFEGSDGWIWVTRGSIKASSDAILKEPLGSNAIRLYASDDHMGNLFNCIRTRKAPICEAEVGHRSASVCHLGAISVRLGRKLKWEAAKEQFPDDADAQKFLAREMRKPWGYDSV